MDEELVDKQSQEKEDKKDSVRKILINLVESVKKEELKRFTSNIEPAYEEINKFIDETYKENRELQIENFKNKVAIIAFNGVLIALMVGSIDKIHYYYLSFVLLFLSISVGILQLVIYYLKNEYDHIKGVILGEKCKQVFNFCRTNKDKPEVVHDTESFVRNICLKKGDKKFENIPELLDKYDKHNNVIKQFLAILAFELLFYIPFVFGLSLVMYKLFLYIK